LKVPGGQAVQLSLNVSAVSPDSQGRNVNLNGLTTQFTKLYPMKN
jgi:hypothetical protein